MELDATLDDLVRLQEEYEKRVKEAAEPVKQYIADFVRSTPHLHTIKWQQYTPYFNDGDTCEFGMYDPGFYFDDDDASDGYIEEYSVWVYDGSVHCNDALKKHDDWEQIARACHEFSAKLMALEAICQRAFGDHVEITATATGITIEEYDHD